MVGSDVVERRRLYRVAVVKSSGGRRARLELFHLVVALPLHAPVLEPDLDLSLGEVQLVGELGATSTRQVAVEVELLLQLERLKARVRRTSTLRVRPVTAAICTIIHASIVHAVTSPLLETITELN